MLGIVNGEFELKLLKVSEILRIIANDPTGYHVDLKHQHREFYDYVRSCYFGSRLAECLYRYCYPGVYRCYTCGSFDVGFLEFTTGYRKYCSRYCTSHSEAQQVGAELYRNDPVRIQAQLAKSKQTCLQRYGEEYYSSTDEGKNENRRINTEYYRKLYPMEINGRDRKQYTAAVRHLTNIIYDEYKDIIDPNNLRSMDWVLDHVYSIYDGFVNEVPLDVICHWTNLELISKSDNSSKGPKSNKTLEELYEGYASPTSSIPSPLV